MTIFERCVAGMHDSCAVWLTDHRTQEDHACECECHKTERRFILTVRIEVDVDDVRDEKQIVDGILSEIDADEVTLIEYEVK